MSSVPTATPSAARAARAAARGGAHRVLRFLPRVLLSRMLGFLERVPLPVPLRRRFYGAYCRRFGANLEEAEQPLESFRSFNEFFVRRLKPGIRPVDPDPASVVSPVDGRVAACGAIERGRLLQAKGLDYSLEELVTVPMLSASLVGGCYVTIYLAPGDYHRIHSPVDGDVLWAVHRPGSLWPVNDAAAAAIRDLFVVNERLVTVLETSRGTAALVKVGAFNVGSIRVDYDARLGRGRRARHRAFPVPAHYTKGAEIARFEMGSTVIVLLPRTFELRNGLSAGTRLRCGEPIARAR